MAQKHPLIDTAFTYQIRPEYRPDAFVPENIHVPDWAKELLESQANDSIAAQRPQRTKSNRHTHQPGALPSIFEDPDHMDDIGDDIRDLFFLDNDTDAESGGNRNNREADEDQTRLPQIDTRPGIHRDGMVVSESESALVRVDEDEIDHDTDKDKRHANDNDKAVDPFRIPSTQAGEEVEERR